MIFVGTQAWADDWSPLSLAAAKGNLEIVESLIDQGADLGQTFRFQGRVVTPFLLAAQYGHFDVMSVILHSKKFTGEHLKQEVRIAAAWNQRNLVKQLLMLRLEGGGSPDGLAQSYRAMDLTCEICFNLPGVGEGEHDQTQLIDGSWHIGDSVMTTCCQQTYCKSCIERSIREGGARCPHCREQSFGREKIQVISHAVLRFRWIEEFAGGASRVPLPGAVVAAEPQDPFAAISEEDPRYVEAFAELGPMHEIAGLVWSSPVPRNVNRRFGGDWFWWGYKIHDGRMNQRAAVAYCEELGGWVPAPQEYESLAQAMGKGTERGFQPDLLSNMKYHGFWTLYHQGDRAAFFSGDKGEVGWDGRDFKRSVRCVKRVVPPRR